MTRHLEAAPWRMLRRLLNAHPKGLTFLQVRNWSRKDKEEQQLRELARLGLVVIRRSLDGKACYHITPAGIAAADLGEIEQTGAA
ncbi:hypothetical protein [Limnoglobus roseus]|uniref:ArsR family transcriptional regulator n=1 Tax=Limnoglobus roseus TaxID=2598579 RepID=A0A5C1ANR6_9BACT|nr:hypothetical protein [Limnoglobus roseus]QEL18508.1 hypothetical protein PX52LOC_05534 [Limnoglobus roseus]